MNFMLFGVSWMEKAGIVKKVFSEMLPFVARSPEMKIEWLLGTFKKKALNCAEIAPYMHLLLAEYENEKEAASYSGDEVVLGEIFSRLSRTTIVEMINCVEIYDIPVLLELVGELTAEEAVLVLGKSPPAYEKMPMMIFDRVFQAVHHCGDNLIENAAEKMRDSGVLPDHFDKTYERFKEILVDEKILSSLYPDAKA